jgi:ArsR family transcriptional regulator, arsenate/arsenite/antimonite-responsive transcriptional repressor
MSISPDVLFRALSDETRWRSLLLMEAEGELCVCELTHALRVVQPKVSRHLAILRESGLVLDRREGLWVYYRIHPDLPRWAHEVIRAAVRGVDEQEPHASDRQALQTMPNRPGARCCAESRQLAS